MSGKTARTSRRETAAAKGTQSRVQTPGQRVDDVRRRRLRVALVAAVVVVAAIGGLYALTSRGGDSGGGATANSEYPFAVGAPGPGQEAPPVALSSTSGDTFDLASFRGEGQVLLFFQEGLMCQPCWDQMVAIERDLSEFEALGISQIVGITGDPLDLLEQKVADEGIRSQVLSDSNYAVSDTYDARAYGMMGGQMAGHSFVLVGEDGVIRWRADYGGEPKYTMFVPTDVLLADIRRGLGQA